ncbi:MAG: helix-turn-helix transcriptional regulator, partial [Clostridiales bacterium]|nr:helix-turn-helix transcriptional regulator [Clostridiales bacterium]
MLPLYIQTGDVNIFNGCNPIMFTRIKFNRPPNPVHQHIHSQFELYFLLEGEVDFIVENTSNILINKGIVIVRNGEYHAAQRIIADNYDHCFFYISDNSLPEMNSITPSLLSCFVDRQLGCDNFVLPSDEEYSKMRIIIERITELTTESMKNPEAENQYAKFAATLELFELVNSAWRKQYRPNDRKHKAAGRDTAKNPIVNRALQYIDENFRSISSIDEIAAVCSVSHSHLTRVFKESLGVTPIVYLRNKRISYAKLLLTDGYDVTSACFYSGFLDYSYFIQVFRASEGM